MANIFNAAEIIDMGIEKEVKRRDFYGQVASIFQAKEMKELFGRLRDWEDAHIKKFTEIRNSIEESETHESYPGELETYMKAVIDDMIYSKASTVEFAKNVKSELMAIEYGMVFEKDAILFFNELLKFMSSYHKEKVQELIDEEKKHLIYLAELKKKYK